MSMHAKFVQVDEADLSRIVANPSSAEALFQDESLAAPASAFMKLMQGQMRTGGPQITAETLSKLPPPLRQQLEQSLSRTNAALASGSGDTILKLMQARTGRPASPASAPRSILSLDKAWHGVHYVLCGETEPGPGLLSQAVLGGVELGDDPEGFSGYGPARYFAASQVAELARALSPAEVESEAAARFDASRMTQLEIYPGFESSDAEWVMDAFRRLREFYVAAAAQKNAIVTCLV